MRVRYHTFQRVGGQREYLKFSQEIEDLQKLSHLACYYQGIRFLMIGTLIGYWAKCY